MCVLSAVCEVSCDGVCVCVCVCVCCVCVSVCECECVCVLPMHSVLLGLD